MIMQKLKEATREQHENLEKTVNIMYQMFSIEDYKVLLCKFYRFYSAIETKLAEFDLKKHGYNLEERLKTPKLLQDLAVLGILEEATKLPIYKGLPKINSPEEAFGALYVLEGATLGGQIISRHLKQVLSISNENGGLFFSGYGEKTGEMWKEFIQITTQFSESKNADETIINTAKETFDSFRDCFLESINFKVAKQTN